MWDGMLTLSALRFWVHKDTFFCSYSVFCSAGLEVWLRDQSYHTYHPKPIPSLPPSPSLSPFFYTITMAPHHKSSIAISAHSTSSTMTPLKESLTPSIPSPTTTTRVHTSGPASATKTKTPSANSSVHSYSSFLLLGVRRSMCLEGGRRVIIRRCVWDGGMSTFLYSSLSSPSNLSFDYLMLIF